MNEPVPIIGPLFDLNASETLQRVEKIFCQRGAEYGDSWRHAQWLAIKATAKTMGVTLDTEQARKIAAAALVDVKYQRLEGGYKEDTVDDGIAYNANWAALMKR